MPAFNQLFIVHQNTDSENPAPGRHFVWAFSKVFKKGDSDKQRAVDSAVCALRDASSKDRPFAKTALKLLVREYPQIAEFQNLQLSI
ncbi:MAG: hypothetical protein KGH54_01940 [Candidatus Micrarchaeota archaeon]|nr:hypothetical protein [Candidatus Micrarchaeota archaeon]